MFLDYANGFDYNEDAKLGNLGKYKSDAEIKEDMKKWKLKDFREFKDFNYVLICIPYLQSKELSKSLIEEKTEVVFSGGNLNIEYHKKDGFLLARGEVEFIEELSLET